MVASVTRYSLSALIAVVFALALFWLMQLIITGDGDVFAQPQSGNFARFIRIKAIEPEPAHKVQPPPSPRRPPGPPRITPTISSPKLNLAAVSRYLPQDLAIDFNIALGDGEYWPVVEAEPLYPVYARNRGIEGQVLVKFDINASGQTINPVVVQSDPPGVFERAALDAVRRFRYQPRRINGQAVLVSDVQKRFVFRFSDPGRR